ncbi:heavy metal-associated isoprenylated plant protein 2-like [Cynara cardunculus var. scolymus]|uniref:Heavy metal-associated domain, HMA n=1 Tax=Cynara cardunculus var. scolymus TaxID=59895 RepID=A0A124SFR6_CYNCS|nr:heavy metal-associated isoprenylated plant protein 2-like [Cynara cardunculus var. scolymus]KVI04078.1 Heavy metal-associated domain, HMA [Cynara cardunculus var. scolymus]
MVLKAVSKLSGINEVSVNLNKQELVVIGDVDPVCVVRRVRDTGKIAEIISVGPIKKPDVPKPKPEPKRDHCECPKVYPRCNDACSTIVIGYQESYTDSGCMIM